MLALVFSITFIASAQQSKFEGTKQEIVETFGTMPSFFAAFPQHALPGAWEAFKALTGPETQIEPKNRELIQLAVAAQIPCQYCVYFHIASAKANGATEQEIQEAVALGANTRHWSMILQGAQIEFEDFKKEFDNMMEYMSSKAKE
jgi:AhpD family alkylhydroperoxidase